MIDPEHPYTRYCQFADDFMRTAISPELQVIAKSSPDRVRRWLDDIVITEAVLDKNSLETNSELPPQDLYHFTLWDQEMSPNCKPRPDPQLVAATIQLTVDILGRKELSKRVCYGVFLAPLSLATWRLHQAYDTTHDETIQTTASVPQQPFYIEAAADPLAMSLVTAGLIGGIAFTRVMPKHIKHHLAHYRAKRRLKRVGLLGNEGSD